MYKKYLLNVLLTLFLFSLYGCASYNNAVYESLGYGVVTEEVSSFDGTTKIQAAPTWVNHPDRTGLDMRYQTFLGVTWVSNTPDVVYLVVTKPGSTSVSSYGGSVYTQIKGIDININGKIKTFMASTSTSYSNSGYDTVLKSISTESSNVIIIPYSYLKEMTTAADCKLRMHTSDADETQLFTAETTFGGVKTAIVSIRELIKKVDKVRINK